MEEDEENQPQEVPDKKMYIEQSIKVFIAFEDRPLTILEFPLDVTVHDALNQVAIVLDIDERDASDKVLRLKYGRTELRPDWFLYDCCLPAGVTLRAVYIEETKPSCYVRLPVFNETIPITQQFVMSTATVQKLRSIISSETGLPVSLFQLRRKNDKMNMYDGHTLDYYGLSMGDHVIAETWKGWDEFLIATRHGFTESLLENIEDDPSVLGSFKAKVALYMAAHYGHTELASELMKLGYSASEPIGEHPRRQWCLTNKEGMPQPHPDLLKAPIHVASDRGQLGVLRSMVTLDASCLMAKFYDARALNLCLRKGHKKCSAFLIAKQWSKISYAGGFLTLGIVYAMKRWAIRSRTNIFLCHGATNSTLKRRPMQWAPLLNEGILIDSPKDVPLDITIPSLVSNNPKYTSLPPINMQKLLQMKEKRPNESRCSSYQSNLSFDVKPTSAISAEHTVLSLLSGMTSSEYGFSYPRPHKSEQPIYSGPATAARAPPPQHVMSVIAEEEEHHGNTQEKKVLQEIADTTDDNADEIDVEMAVTDSVTSLSVNKPSKLLFNRPKQASYKLQPIKITDSDIDYLSLDKKSEELDGETSGDDVEVQGASAAHRVKLSKSRRKRPLVKKLSLAMVERVLQEDKGQRKEEDADIHNQLDDSPSSEESPSQVGYTSRLKLFRSGTAVPTLSFPPSKIVQLLEVDQDKKLEKNKELPAVTYQGVKVKFEKKIHSQTGADTDIGDGSKDSDKSKQLLHSKSVPLPQLVKTNAEKQSSYPQSSNHQNAVRTMSESSSVGQLTGGVPPGQIGQHASVVTVNTTSNSYAGATQKQLSNKEKMLAALIAEKSKTLSCPIPLPAPKNAENFPKPWVNPRKINTSEDPNSTIRFFNDRYRPNKDARTAAIEQLYRANQFTSLNFLKRVRLAIDMSQRKVRQTLDQD